MPVQKPFRPRIQDPGASLITIPVRDVRSVMAKLKEDGAPVSSDGVVTDPDGFFVRLVEGTSGAKLSLTVDNMERTLRLFRDLLGFQGVLVKSRARILKWSLSNTGAATGRWSLPRFTIPARACFG